MLIDDSAWYAGFVAGTAPSDRVSRICTTYEATGEPSTVTAYTNNINCTVGGGVLAQNVYEYDAFRNLTREWQQHFAVADSGSPAISYEWERLVATTGVSGYSRLESMTYPQGREVNFSYGTFGSVEDSLTRITGVGSPQGLLDPAALFEYTGTGRRVFTLLGNSLVYSLALFGPPIGYIGLDRFGRVRDLHWTSGGQTVLRYQYGYDRAGNRLHARVKHDDLLGTVQDNERSWRYGYDGLSRLVSADMGALDAANSAIVPTAGTASRSIDWSLDNLGNWSGDADEQSVVTAVDTDGDGDVDATTVIHHEVNSANELQEIIANGSAALPFVDPAGNLTQDGQSPTSLVYQYDGLNRLVQVNERGGALFNADGKITGGTLGPLVMAFVYDGQGRVIQKSGLIPPTANSGGTGFGRHGFGLGGQPPPPTPPTEYAEDYYYDGVRRVQDVVTIGTTTTLDREYVYGPGDVNEVLFQFDAAGNVYYLHHDANLNVVALTADAGDVVEQYTYSPYGELLNVETLGGGTPKNKIGFQGMFFDRLTTQPTQSHMVAEAPGLYRTPNRSYSPTLGRWLQRDPNATGQLIVDSPLHNGSIFESSDVGFVLDSLFADGSNVYLFEDSRPVIGRDPLGLSTDFDWDSEADDLAEEIQGHKLYALGEINEGARWASLGLQTTLDIGSSLLGLDLFESISLLANGSGGFWEVLDVTMAALPALKLAVKGAKLATAARAQRFRAIKECNCFEAGTLVETPTGSKPIECLDIGDEVLTWSDVQPSGPPMVGAVTYLFKDVAPSIIWLTLANGQILKTTPDHQVWAFDRGWTTMGVLLSGDRLRGEDGSPVEIIETKQMLGPTPVFNIEVDGTFTYFASGVWVHNNSCRALAGLAYKTFNRRNFRHNLIVRTGIDDAAQEAHHVFPHKFEAFFQRAGMRNIHDPRFGVWWEALSHRRNAHGYNALWERFWENPNRTINEVIEEGRRIAGQFGLNVEF